MPIIGDGIGNRVADFFLRWTELLVGEGEGVRCLPELVETSQSSFFARDQTVQLLAQPCVY
jgi:hypothetical protein